MFRTLAARLTFLYILLFCLLSLLVFAFISSSLEENLLSRVDDYFLEEAGEFATILHQGGLEAVRAEIRLETESKGVEQLFIRIYSDQQQSVAVSDLRSWSALPELQGLNATGGQADFTMLELPGARGKARIFQQTIGQGYVFQAGMLLAEDQLLLTRLRSFFAVGFICTLIGGAVAGFWITKKALTGVRKVQERADLISQGDLSREIDFHDKSEEVNHMIASVNHMQRQIKKLIRELQDVTNNIAHDLRSPITRMRGVAETSLIGEASAEELRNMAGAVVEDCDCLVGMINTMMEIAETDAGIRPLATQQLDLALLLNDVVDLYSVPAEDKRISLELQLEAPSLPLVADRSRLQRAFANILDNALKFTPPGGRVLVTAALTDSWGTVRIADSGAGIAPADLPRVCERYYRADRSRQIPGTGLGLSLVQAIVQAHHGELEITSDGSSGTVVEVRLPLETV